MAINPETQYPGKVAASSAPYPYGQAQNITTPGDGTGTPWEAALLNDIFGFQQALLKAAGNIVPSGSPDQVGTSQYLQSVIEIAAGRAHVYDESGVADAYVLDLRGDMQAPAAYFDGMRIEFTPGNNNTGASTVNVASLGVKNIIDDGSGAALVAGQLDSTRRAECVYDGTQFRLIRQPGKVVQRVSVQDGEVATGVTTLPIDDTIPQITEGNEFMTLAITPKNVNNILQIDVVCFVSNSADNQRMAAALFQDATANALACGWDYDGNVTVAPQELQFTHTMVAGTISPTTFRVRAGAPNAGTTTFNGISGTRRYGGVLASSIIITEFEA